MKKKVFATAFLSLLLVASPAAAATKGGGASLQAPGYERAIEICDWHILDQLGRVVHSGGGPKEPTEEDAQAPTNCDHYWQTDGFIGNG